MTILRFIGVNRDTTTAGPGKRLEFFTKGCIRGVISPCKGCFNEQTWMFQGPSREMTVDEVVDICVETAWNRQVTFCGGEPILQARALTQVAKRLKEIDPTFHFVMYTAYKLDTLLKYGLKFTWVPKYEKAMGRDLYEYSNSIEHLDTERTQFTILTPEDVRELMQYVDLIVDGDYKQNERLTTEKYMHEGWFVGSANQRVIFGPLSMRVGELKFLQADAYNKQMGAAQHCKCCGHSLPNRSMDYCNVLCKERHKDRVEELALIGGI